MTRAAAILAWFVGLGFGVPAVFGLRHFVRHHEVWTFLGFPTYGGGLFERWGFPTSVPLLAGFLLLCVAEVAVGVALWPGRPAGLWLALALLPSELVYWIGFALPFGPVLGAIRTVLVVLALMWRCVLALRRPLRQSLRHRQPIDRVARVLRRFVLSEVVPQGEAPPA